MAGVEKDSAIFLDKNAKSSLGRKILSRKTIRLVLTQYGYGNFLVIEARPFSMKRYIRFDLENCRVLSFWG